MKSYKQFVNPTEWTLERKPIVLAALSQIDAPEEWKKMVLKESNFMKVPICM